ncbi:MAG: GntR family transcriptional regulator [Pseudomonadota bacterium]
MDYKIYDTLRQRILFMEYPPGTILNEKTLAAEFGLSRSPIRDVLNRLEWAGLVRVIPRTGTLVSEVEFRKMMEVYQVRLEIEGLVGRMAAEQITDGHLDQIRETAEECRKLFSDRNRRRLIGVDMKFRLVMYDAANNEPLKEISQHLYDQTLRVWFSFFDRSDWRVEVQGMLDEITQTHQVLASRAPLEAARVRQHFLQNYLDRLKGKF